MIITQAQFKCAANFYWVSRQTVEGGGIRINWSFFTSCHGKCYCDPEGGTLKNAARNYELNVSDRAMQMKQSYDLFLWARDRSGLSRPRYSLHQKKGRGIYRRFFYWIPSKGIGAVNRLNLPKLKAEGTSKLHEFVDIGVVGTVSTRRASCHRCDGCWDAVNRSQCANSSYVGTPIELSITRDIVPAAAAQRMNRATLNRDAIERARGAAIGSIVCIETHHEEQMHPWVLGRILQGARDAVTASTPFEPAKDLIRFDSYRANEPILRVQLYEAVDVGSCTYFASEITALAPAKSVRVVDIKLQEARASARVQESMHSSWDRLEHVCEKSHIYSMPADCYRSGTVTHALQDLGRRPSGDPGVHPPCQPLMGR